MNRLFGFNQPLLNDRGEVIGRGSKAMAMLWNGNQAIGSISADNLLSGRAINDYDLEILSLYGSIVGDLIAQKQAEAELLNERNLLRTIIDTTSDYIYMKDTHHRLMLVNKTSWSNTLGITSEADMLGQTDYDYLPPELATQFIADEEELFRTGQAILNREEPGIDSAGNPIHFLTSKVPLRDAQGNITGLVGVSRDITDIKMAEAALRKSEERLRLATDSANIGTWDWDIESNQILWGNYAQSLLGMDQDDKRNGEHLEEFLAYIDPFDRNTFSKAITETMEHHEPFDVEYRYLHRDGRLHWMNSQGEVYRDESGKPARMVGIIREITDQKDAERERLEYALQKERLI